MGLINFFRDARAELHRDQIETRGKIVAQEAAKTGNYEVDANVLLNIAIDNNIVEGSSHSDLRLHIFAGAVLDESDRLAQRAGMEYCIDCNGWYLPHEH